MSEDRDYGHEVTSGVFGYHPETFAVGLQREIEEYKKLMPNIT